MITLICQTLGVCQTSHATSHTFSIHFHLRTPSPFNAFNISGRNSSSLTVFPDFSLCVGAAIPLSQKQSYRMCQWMLPLLGSTNFKIISPS